MTYPQALRILVGRQETRIRLGQARIRRHLAALGNPQEAYRSIHVAGTNGKGSVCAMLDSILRENGYKTGLYISPHLRDVRERARVNGRMIPREAFARLLGRALAAERRTGEPLSYFELVTSIAFQYFREAGVRIAVLETGLGGRFDATNVVRRPLATIVPSIDWDHMDFLGDTLKKIAGEKAGIFKPGVPALTIELKPEPLAELRRVARKKRAPFAAIDGDARWTRVAADWRHGVQRAVDRSGREFSIGLLGAAQPRNAALVLETVSALRARGTAVSDRSVVEGLARARWPGRFEILRAEGGVAVLDGAHNPQAMSLFRRTLESSPWRAGKKLFLIGMLKDKDHAEMVRLLAPCLEGQSVVTVRPLSPRALEPGLLAEEIRARAPSSHVSVLPDLGDALVQWRPKRQALFVCGSFYLIGPARAALGAAGD